MKNMIENFIKDLKRIDNIYFYGAGIVCHRMVKLCKEFDIEVKGILVQNTENNPFDVLGIPVYSLEEKQTEFPTIDLVVAIAGREYTIPGLENTLFDLPFRSIYITSEANRVALAERERKKEREKASEEVSERMSVMIDQENELSEPGHIIVFDKLGERALFRSIESEFINDTEKFCQYANYDNFTRLFGNLTYVEHGKVYAYSKECVRANRIAAFIATSHFDQTDVKEIEAQGCVPLQVGAALTDQRKGCRIDCEGDHISNRNLAYSECTGLYWIYKNLDFNNVDYVGYGQYRRRLVLDDESINDIKDKGLDVVLSLPTFTVEILKEFFLRFIPEKDWLLMKDYILEANPEYASLWDQYENGHFLFPCNLMLWKKEWFLKYCEFAFGITEKINDYYESRNIIRQDRYMGYLFENLTTFFALSHRDEIKIGYTELKGIG